LAITHISNFKKKKEKNTNSEVSLIEIYNVEIDYPLIFVLWKIFFYPVMGEGRAFQLFECSEHFSETRWAWTRQIRIPQRPFSVTSASFCWEALKGFQFQAPNSTDVMEIFNGLTRTPTRKFSVENTANST